MESNVGKTYVDINVMADQLQRTYREYGKRKRSAFRQSVKKAYSIVLQSYNVGEGQGSSSDVESEESIGVEESFVSSRVGGLLRFATAEVRVLPKSSSSISFFLCCASRFAGINVARNEMI